MKVFSKRKEEILRACGTQNDREVNVILNPGGVGMKDLVVLPCHPERSKGSHFLEKMGFFVAGAPQNDREVNVILSDSEGSIIKQRDSSSPDRVGVLRMTAMEEILRACGTQNDREVNVILNPGGVGTKHLVVKRNQNDVSAIRNNIDTAMCIQYIIV